MASLSVYLRAPFNASICHRVLHAGQKTYTPLSSTAVVSRSLNTRRRLPRSRPPASRRPPSASSTSPPPQPQDQQTPTPPPPEPKKSSLESISSTLNNADPTKNSLLSPVHVAEDPHGVLNERHPATSILANSSLVVTRQLEMMNVMLGFEQANKYVIMDGQGQHIGYMAEKDLGMGNMFKRQMFGTHRSFETHVFDRSGREVLRFHRPFSWISSRIGIYDAAGSDNHAPSPSTALSPITPGTLMTDIDQGAVKLSNLSLSEMRIIGESQQQWAPLRRKYNLFLHRDTPEMDAPQLTSGELPLSNSTALQPSAAETPNSGGRFGQFAYVDEPFLSWDFSLLTQDKRLMGSVNRNFAGFGRELFTDTGVYALRMDSASLEQEPKHLISKTGQRHEGAGPAMTLDQRAVMLATAVSVDFDYFSRHSGNHGGIMPGFWPLWLPGGGGAAAEGAEGAAAGAEAGESTGVMEGAEGGVRPPGAPEAAAGAGAYGLYEQTQGQGQGDGFGPEGDGQQWGNATGDTGPRDYPQQNHQGEEIWGQGNDPWSQGDGGDGGGGGGDSGDGGSWLSDLLDD